MRDTTATLTVAEAVPLGYALVDHLARRDSLPCLAIKGPVLQAQGLRGGHASIDVDVLVAPDDRESLAAALIGAGWETGVVSTTAHVGTFHSVQLRREDWPCEIDLHDRFPGILADPADAFAVLWERRVEVSIAGVPVFATDPVASGLIGLLHALRTPQRKAAALAAQEESLRGAWDDGAREDAAVLADALGAPQELRESLARVGVSLPPPRGAWVEAERVWALQTRSEGRHSVGWVAELRRTPLRELPAFLKRALLLSEPEIRILYPHLPPGRRGLWRGRVLRWGVGLRSLPSAVRTVFGEPRSG